ncbi:crinkler (CRN) family protein [Seminavis robusta]|uniref:Crinkler (CRN) family protein n=1 Tax=Seminavis robusta TaxID=568900 RepID=A0A9N8HV62_9STRA|nr:crinkler (CRN) family protein [Seminavis robusta]|eukprot:Sro1936_g306400.1 crinkler (CRN) family protein (604) ;mRNA; f:10999-12810
MATAPSQEQTLDETVATPDESPYKRQRKASEANLKALLIRDFARDKGTADSALEKFHFERHNAYSMACDMLKAGNLINRGESPSGLKAMEIPQDFYDKFGWELFHLQVRPSRLYFERSCYPKLFDAFMEMWRKNNAEKIILTGNAGIGKSWFQVYFLKRLLQMTPEARSDIGFMPRFILRQYKTKFILIDLATSGAWKMVHATPNVDMYGEVEDFLAAFNNMFYMFEPEQDQSIIPLNQAATPAFSSISPNPKRLKGYKKQASPLTFVYTPNWSYGDLNLVLKLEDSGQDFDFESQYHKFGGIIRRTLEYSKRTQKEYTDELEERIQSVDIKVIRSMHLGLDDSSNAQLENNISGYICAYHDIPECGHDAFSKHDLIMTSDFARIMVREKLSLTNPKEHGRQLLECLAQKAQDTTGMDLEVSAVHLLSLGPKTVRWDYNAVGYSSPAIPVPIKLGHRKMEINRSDDAFDQGKVNYPTNPVFGLVDFLIFLDGTWWGFQTTWQRNHPFKLRTLQTFRNKIGADETTVVNILYVLPTTEKMNAYTKRAKVEFLDKGENLLEPIKENTREVLSAEKVRSMWENTNIFVSYPAAKDWRNALETWISG